MKENSPTWASPIPLTMLVWKSRFNKSTAPVVITILSSKIVPVAAATRASDEPTKPVSRSIPTEMKKIPLNASRKGRTSEMACSP